jgi:hypothetical protein
VVVRYGALGSPADSVVVTDHAWRTVRFPVTADHIWSAERTRNSEWWQFLGIPKPPAFRKFQERTGRQYFVLSLQTSREWTPEDWGVSGDNRRLAVAVSIERFDEVDPTSEQDNLQEYPKGLLRTYRDTSRDRDTGDPQSKVATP